MNHISLRIPRRKPAYSGLPDCINHSNLGMAKLVVMGSIKLIRVVESASINNIGLSKKHFRFLLLAGIKTKLLKQYHVWG